MPHAELARTRDRVPPSVIDLSELRFLDLLGLRALLRAVEGDVAGTARLVGATGIVRRLIELAHTLDSDGTTGTTIAARAPFPSEPATALVAQNGKAAAEPARAAVNGSRRNVTAKSICSTNGDAA